MRAPEKNSRFSRRWKWLSLGVVCLGLFALRHNLAGFAVDVLLRQAFNSKQGASFAYANVEWNGYTIAIGELDIETPRYRLAVQRLEIVLDFSFSPFHVSPHLWVVRPYVIFQDQQENDRSASEAVALAAPLGLLDWLRLDIVEGRCEWTPRESALAEDLYFQFLSGTSPEVMGALELFATPEMEDPLIRAEVAHPIDESALGNKDGLVITWATQNLATQHLLPLVWGATGHAISGWERIEGNWALSGRIALDESGDILDLQSTLAVTNLELRNAELGLHLAARTVVLDLQQLQTDPASTYATEVPWYQRIEARAIIEEGEIECAQPLAEHPWGITHVDGRMVWCEKEDPVFSLKGVTIQEDGEKELFVQGTGSLGNEHSFWLQTYLTWGAEEKPLLEATLSLCSPEPSSLVVEAQVSELQMSAAPSLIALLGLPQEDLQSFQFTDGTLKGVVTAWLEGVRLERIDLRDIAFDKLGVNWAEKGQAKGCSGTLEGSWRHHEAGWANNHLMLTFYLDKFQPAFSADTIIEDLQGECLIEGEKISRGSAKGWIGEVQFFSTCAGAPDAYQINLAADTTLSACLKTFSLASSLDIEAAKKIALQMRFEGMPKLDGGSLASLQVMGNILVQNGDEPGKEIAIECNWPEGSGCIPKGKIHADALPVAVGLPFLKKVLPETQCKGDFGIDGTFDEKGIELQIDIPRLQIATSLINVELLPPKEKRARGTLTAAWASGDFHFLLPLKDAQVALPPFDLAFTHVGAWMELSKRKAIFKDFSATCEGIALQGELHIDSRALSLQDGKMKGRFEGLEKVFVKATRGKYQPIGITGDFSSGPEGFLFTTPLDLKTDLKIPSLLVFQCAFSSASLPLPANGALKEVAGTAAFDSRKHSLTLGDVHGVFCSQGGADYTWALQPAVFLESDNQWEGTLDATLYQHQLELLRFVSLTRLSPDSIAFAADPRQTHLLGSTIEKGKGAYHFKAKQSHFQGIVNWDLEQLTALAELGSDLRLLEQEDLPAKGFLGKPSAGIMRVAFDYDSSLSQLQFTLEGKELLFFGTPCPYFGCQGRKQADQWKITDAFWGENRLQLDLTIKKNEWAIPSFNAMVAGIETRGSAVYAKGKKEWKCHLQTVNVPFGKERLQCQSKQPLIIDCKDKDRCVIKGLLLEESENRSQLECPTLQIDWKDKTFLVRSQHRLTPKFIKRLLPKELSNTVSISPKEPLEGTLQIEGNWKEGFTYQAQAAWKECLFKYGEKSLPFTAISGRYRDGTLLVGGRTLIGQTATIVSLQLDQRQETLGVLKLQETPEENGLSLFFRVLANGAFEPSHITGEFSGVKTQLRKKSGGSFHLHGTTEVDFAKLGRLFPRDAAPPWHSLKLGKGFIIEGDISSRSDQLVFQGEIRGDQCELLGCLFHSLHTGVTWQQQRLKFEKLQVIDPALTLAVRSLVLEETAAGKIWTLSCPVAQVREFQPSRLRKIGKSPSAEKPFVLRNFTLLDFMGDLGNPKSFSGNCSLHFTNASKREESFFDIPLDFLKDIGLEPTLLVPIQGELEGHFENGRLLFTDLKSSYSEGRRTQFFISDRGDGSYIDFQGNMHIDLRVSQAVLLKLAESLTLGIRGSVAKPLYILLP